MIGMELTRITEKQKKLVDTLVAKGCSVKQASEEAGYAQGESGRVSASKALKTPHVQQYMMQQIADSIGINATIASNKLLRLASGAKSEYVQLEASKDILDRAGFKAPDKVMHSHVGNINVKIDLS
jgi:phage terminase small subunit|tara:strand:+ start:750 stop:1127 length:378 start_codon:yes stop_codon:yes gene_type:complete